MTKSRRDQRKHRRKVAGSEKGLAEHRKRRKRRKKRRPFKTDEYGRPLPEVKNDD